MPVDVTTSITIDRPLQVVASYAAEPDHVPQWYSRICSVDWCTPPPLAVGTRLDFVAQFLGRRLAYTYEVTELVEGRRLVMGTRQGPFPMETTYSWDDAGEQRTRMTLRNRGEPAGFSRLVAPFMATAVRRANRQDLTRLKQVVEDRPW